MSQRENNTLPVAGGFRALKDASRNFEEELRRVSTELLSAKICSFEDGIAKKLRDLSLYLAKLRLLRANPQSLTPQVTEHDHDEASTLEGYGETVAARNIEQQLVKSATQAQAVKSLITAPNHTLDPEMVERKEKILEALSIYRTKEASVLQLTALLKEKEAALAETVEQWHRELDMLRDLGSEHHQPDTQADSALYHKLNATVKKMELMRWLMTQLSMLVSRGYDWLGDPHGRLRALKLAREHYSVEQFLEQH